MKTNYKIVDRPGYFGKRRAEKEAEYNRLYGDKWLECWQMGCGPFMTFEEAVYFYDLSYYIHLRDNPGILKLITNEFSGCYDSEPSNMDCGLQHDPTSHPRHIQDVSIRRAVAGLGFMWTAGKPLMQVRGPETPGWFLAPMLVPFIQPGWILGHHFIDRVVKEWVRHDSVEEFWQRNKVIVVPLGTGVECK